ncbi:hypothetical protein DSM104443_03343 [Usitatibacter rugosus]|uniref:Uncharacterized protein n=1 Tax=Usitatibacter rugosus TaxID=2732067 RepID=A0A6M4GZF9_9PROT|nr:hypothetical protein [Usitatibacter rugosus]QJR12258.1 hypothetical protein DSM104443_03343 [Usitatibacter rugosus]
MKSKGFIPLAIVAAAVIAFYAWRESSAPSDGAKAASVPSSAQVAQGSGGSGVVGARPGAPGIAPQAGGRATPAKLSLSGELAVARSYKALYDRLANSPEGQTAEGQYVQYRILRACATISDRRGPAQRAPDLTPQREFVASLPETDPTKAKRVAALEQLGEDKCVGLSGIVTTEADLSKRLGDAVAAGSPSARVIQIEQELWQERRASGARGGPTLSDGQVDALRTAIGSADPEALVLAGRVLGTGFRDVTLRLGPDPTPVEGRALSNAFTLMACDYGYPCGDNNPRILQACAFQGHCDAGNLPDFLAYYQTSPYEQQLQTQYRGVLNTAIATRDWSGLTVQRGTAPLPPYPPARR